MRFTVAIDGPAAAGKGTVSKAVAKQFGFAHLDTGLLYRAVGLKVLHGADPIATAITLQPEDLENGDLRTHVVAQAASKCAVIPEVREALVAFQRQFAKREGGAVLDGRDIGTVICPNANVKLFVTASAETRAERRFKELSERGETVEYKQVLRDVEQRDERDRQRETAPLIAAEDAVLIDTSDLTIDQAITAATNEIAAKLR